MIRERVSAVSGAWRLLTIKKKIMTFTGVMFLFCLAAVLFSVWVVRFLLVDFDHILEENAESVQLVQALENEREIFHDYVQRPKDIAQKEWEEAVEETKRAVEQMPFDYKEIGDARYAKTWSVRSCYEVYTEKLEEFLHGEGRSQTYVNDLYELYEMQDYLVQYAGELMSETMSAGTDSYWQRVPSLMRVPWIAGIMGLVMLIALITLNGQMNSSVTKPIMQLVNASRQIAENNFFIEDIQTKNQDEMGELVHAFNKMKYATGEYIMALEEKRAALDMLHKEELERLEIENRLEATKLELLKSQVNPHFLFNTLNVIGGMAALEEAESTEKMIKALSSLFRYNLKTSDVEVPLARELKVVEDYMYLQQMRFGERVSYHINCTVNKEKMYVPAFTFQPLVENAVLHGLAKKEEGGCIRIRIGIRQKKLCIYIGDTGKGMEQKELEELRRKLACSGKEEKQGIGLGNIYRRVNAMYREGSINIYSRMGAGTVVRLEIPQERLSEKEKEG